MSPIKPIIGHSINSRTSYNVKIRLNRKFKKKKGESNDEQIQKGLSRSYYIWELLGKLSHKFALMAKSIYFI